MAYVDCDSHILPEDAFADVPAAFRQEGPRIETDAKGNSCVIYPARQRNIPDYARTIPNPFNPRPRSSGNKPEVRIADMEKAKIDIQVLVPSNGSFYYDVEPELGYLLQGSKQDIQPLVAHQAADEDGARGCTRGRRGDILPPGLVDPEGDDLDLALEPPQLG